MISYIRQLLLMFPSLIGILTNNLIVIQFVPYGSIDQIKPLLQRHSKVCDGDTTYCKILHQVN